MPAGTVLLGTNGPKRTVPSGTNVPKRTVPSGTNVPRRTVPGGMEDTKDEGKWVDETNGDSLGRDRAPESVGVF